MSVIFVKVFPLNLVAIRFRCGARGTKHCRRMGVSSLFGLLRWYLLCIADQLYNFKPQCPGERLWGRGSNDDKSGLIAIMSSIESLLENEFEPTRSVVLSFGFDEEASGIYVRIFHSCSHSHF